MSGVSSCVSGVRKDACNSSHIRCIGIDRVCRSCARGNASSGRNCWRSDGHNHGVDTGRASRLWKQIEESISLRHDMIGLNYAVESPQTCNEIIYSTIRSISLEFYIFVFAWLKQSCPRVTFLGPDPTRPVETLTRPDPRLPTKSLT